MRREGRAGGGSHGTGTWPASPHGNPGSWLPPWGHGCHRGAQGQPRAVPVPQTPEQEHNGTELCRAINYYHGAEEQLGGVTVGEVRGE